MSQCLQRTTGNSRTQSSPTHTAIGSSRPYFKKIWFANFVGGCSNDVLNIMVNDKKKVLPKYLYYNLFQDSFFDYVMSGNKGTKMPRGDKNVLLNYNLPDIDITEQQHIVNTKLY